MEPKLPLGGIHIRFDDGEIYYIEKSSIVFHPNANLRWENYCQGQINNQGYETWRVEQTRDNKAHLLIGRSIYIFETTAYIESELKDKMRKQPFYVECIKFIMTQYNDEFLTAEGIYNFGFVH